MVTQFVLDRGTHSFYRGRDGVVRCHYSKCGELIERFDRVVSRQKGEYRVLYHAECAKKGNII